MNILLIGSGAWPTKIFSGLYSKSTKNQIRQISAREFLLQNTKKYSHFDFIWIATSPDNQIKIISQLQHFSNTIILEKPIFTTCQEYESLKLALMNFKGLAQMSTIWLYSTLWNNSKISVKNIKSIFIKHGYAERRIYCSPLLDWIPHDIYLLNDLGIQLHQSQIISIEGSENGTLNLGLKFAKSVSISLFFYRTMQNSFVWEIESDDTSKITINFSNRSFKEIKYGEVIKTFTDDSYLNPAEAMLEHFLEKTSSNLEDFIESYSYLLNYLDAKNII